MPATIVQLADAVVSTLNAATLTRRFTAERHYVPVFEAKDLVDLRVTVVPSSDSTEPLARSGKALAEVVIDVAVQQRISQGVATRLEMLEACDPLLLLVEEIGDLFRGLTIGSPPIATCTKVAVPLIFDPAHIEQHRVFTSVIKLTCLCGR